MATEMLVKHATAAAICLLLSSSRIQAEMVPEPDLPDYSFSIFSENEILTRLSRRAAETEFIAQYNIWSRQPVITGIALVTGRELVRDSNDIPLKDSNDYGGLAFRVTRNEIAVSAEVRYASDIKPASDENDEFRERNGPDHRLRFNRWRKTTIGMARLPGFSFLNESWLDAEWLPYRDNNAVFNAFDIAGLRGHINEVLAADVYVEPFVLLDANRTYDNNRLEMRGAIRFNLATGNITLQTTGAIVHNFDLPRGDFPENENKESEWSHRFALTLSGFL